MTAWLIRAGREARYASDWFARIHRNLLAAERPGHRRRSTPGGA